MSEIRVGAEEFRVHISRYLREVKRGHVVVITLRGKPVGRIIPSGISQEGQSMTKPHAGKRTKKSP
jgi:prevent-host-death family protein